MTSPYDDYDLSELHVGKLALCFSDPVQSNWDPDDDSWWVTVALVNLSNGEVREQNVALPWSSIWRETARRRMERIHEDALTPQIIIPQKKVKK